MTATAMRRPSAGRMQPFIARVLDDPFFDAPPPKSLDRNAFAFANIGLPEFSIADGAATLAALTVAAVKRHRPAVARRPAGLGGQRRRCAQPHPDAHAGRDALAPASVETADQIGWSADALEAQAFAYLAVRSLRGLADNVPDNDRRAQAARRRRPHPTR